MEYSCQGKPPAAGGQLAVTIGSGFALLRPKAKFGIMLEPLKLGTVPTYTGRMLFNPMVALVQVSRNGDVSAVRLV